MDSQGQEDLIKSLEFDALFNCIWIDEFVSLVYEEGGGGVTGGGEEVSSNTSCQKIFS